MPPDPLLTASAPSKAPSTMAPSSRMNLASLLQSDPPEDTHRPPQSLPPLPPPPATYPPPDSSYQSSHSQPLPPPNYPPASSSSSAQNYPASSQYQHGYPSHGHPPSSQPPPSSQSQHLPPPQSSAHGYHHPPHQGHSYTPSPTHTQHSGPPAPPSGQPHHHSHQYHQHQHAHHHVSSHPLHPPPQGHSHLPSHSHPVVHHAHHHQHHPHGHHQHAHTHSHLQLNHPHSHVHVIHTHPPTSSSASNAPPASSSSVAGSPPGYPSSSHGFSANGPAPSTRAPQPIIPVNSTPAPRSPLHYTGASRSPAAPYSIYGAGAALASGRRSPEFPGSNQPMGASSTSSGARRNTLTSSSGPQAIEPVQLQNYPYPGSGSGKHDDGYPPPFTAPVYSPRPQSPQTGNKSRRSVGGASNRNSSMKRSVGGASELKRAGNERGRESEKDEREMDKEREDQREHREYEDQARATRERDRDRDRLAPLEIEMREGGRDMRRPSGTKRPGLESEFARRPGSSADWDRPRDHRDRGRPPREQERDWRREEEEARQGATLVQNKHLPPISAHGGYAEKQPHLHSHSHSIPSLQQSRPHSHVHHYPPTHQRAASPPPLPYSALPPILSPIWLGTCVYPNLPFPVCLPNALSRSNLTSEGYKPYQYCILVPSGFLPLQPATRIPRPDIPLWGSAITGYTDDSNLLLAAVHSGRTTWSDIRRARRLKQDAKIVVGVWVGGANGGRQAGRPKGGAWEGVEGAGQLHSSSWGNTHDGGGMEIVEVAWIEPGSAHAPHRPNRRERMEQYAKRRADLELIPPVKRDRIDTWYLDSDEEDVAIPAKRVWDVGETIVFGKGGGSGFVYDPHTLRSVVFEESNERSTKRRKSKKGGSSENDVQATIKLRDIVLENDDEQYILALKSDDEDKARKYTLSTLSPKSKKTEVLRKSLTEEDVAFLDQGLCVWLKDGAEAKPAENEPAKDKMDTDGKTESEAPRGEDTDRKGWFCHVSRWKFAPDDLKDSA